MVRRERGREREGVSCACFPRQGHFSFFPILLPAYSNGGGEEANSSCNYRSHELAPCTVYSYWTSTTFQGFHYYYSSYIPNEGSLWPIILVAAVPWMPPFFRCLCPQKILCVIQMWCMALSLFLLSTMGIKVINPTNILWAASISSALFSSLENTTQTQNHRNESKGRKPDTLLYSKYFNRENYGCVGLENRAE